ncbi:MAG: 6-phosphogluconolactonase [bacterium]
MRNANHGTYFKHGNGMLEINTYPSKLDMVTMVGERIIEIINLTIQKQGNCSVALAGGTTPRDAYAYLTEDCHRYRVDWQRVQLFWGDERMVAPEHPDSNYRMVKESLINRINIPDENVHRMRGEIAPDTAAAEYRQILKKKFSEQPPPFDLVLLGVGEDGHTASLFPGTSAIEEQVQPVVAVFVPRLKSWRITLTLPVLNAAKNIVFMVSGHAKSKIVQQIINLEQPNKKLPATLIRPENGRVWWMLDSEAVSLLNK